MADINGVSDANSGASGAAGAGNGTSNTKTDNDDGWRERLLAQRKADQARAVAAEEERDRIKAQLEQAEAAKLAEQKRYQDLYEAEKKRREESDKKLADMTTAQVTSAKKTALREALGGVKKDDYLTFANLAAIQMNPDGTVDADSVKDVAAKFRESHPDLVAVKQQGSLPNDAAKAHTAAAAKPLKDLSHAELAALLAKAK